MQKYPMTEDHDKDRRRGDNGRSRWLNWIVRPATILLIIGIIVAIFFLAPRTSAAFTEFYLLGPADIAYGYPVDVKAGEIVGIKFGVINREQEETSYKVKVSTGGRDLTETSWMSLAPDDQWQHVVSFALPKAGPHQQVYFGLCKNGVEGPFQVLYLWMNAN